MIPFGIRNFQDTFETLKQSFISIFSICMTVSLRNTSVSMKCFSSHFQLNSHNLGKLAGYLSSYPIIAVIFQECLNLLRS